MGVPGCVRRTSERCWIPCRRKPSAEAAAEAAWMEDMELIRRIDFSKRYRWGHVGRRRAGADQVGGCQESPNMGCRLVARDFKPNGEKGRPDIFAAMPPFERRR